MSTKPSLLVAGMVFGLVGGCAADEGTDVAGTLSDAGTSETPSPEPDTDAATSPGPTSSDEGSTGAASTTEGTEEDPGQEPPATCLDGKVGVLNVNTEVVFYGKPDFVVHTYPSNHIDDAPGQLADFLAKVNADPGVDRNFLFASGFSYGASMSLRHGYLGSDKLAGIIHISQYSDPDRFQEEIYQATRRIPVYIIHDDSYGAGGQILRNYLLEIGYRDGVDLFYLDFRGGHDIPPPEQMATVLEWMKTMSLNGPCQDGG